MTPLFTRKISFSVNDFAYPEDGVLQRISNYLNEHWVWSKYNGLEENVYIPKTPDVLSAKEKFGTKNISRWITQGVYLHEGLFCPEGQDAEKCLAENKLDYCPLLRGGQTTEECILLLTYD